MDNRYVEGSNYPIVRTDDRGNSFQRRTLQNGAEWEVLKNFPSPEWLECTLEQYAPNVTVHCWDYYWAATCSTSEPSEHPSQNARLVRKSAV